MLLQKSKNLELLENLKKWFKFKFEIIYFYNVYGPRQIQSGNMAILMIGIFENQYINRKPLTIVKPGSQTRRFTHITTQLMFVMKHGEKVNVLIIVFQIKSHIRLQRQLKMFKSKVVFLKPRPGERYACASNKIFT